MAQSRKTCSPVKKYTLTVCIERIASKHTTAITLALFYTYIHFKLVKWFLVSPKTPIYTYKYTKCDGILGELSISDIHNKTTSKRANEQADDERIAEDETKAK